MCAEKTADLAAFEVFFFQSSNFERRQRRRPIAIG